MQLVRRARRWSALVVPAAAFALLLSTPPAPATAATIPLSTSAGPYTYLARQPANTRVAVRWNACVTHRYKIYVGGTNAATRLLLRNTVARLSRVSGIPLVFAGYTSVLPSRSNAGNLPRTAGADIVLAFTTPGRTNLLPATAAGLLGVGGGYYSWSGSRPAVYTSGYAVFNTRRLPSTAAGRLRMFEHEIGHTLGLGHTRLRSDVMYPVQYSSSPTWSLGYARGLIAVGRAAGCPR